MGDRANVKIRGFGDVYLYTHWCGSELPGTLQRALARRQRWEDASYLARVVFCEMVGEDGWCGELGYGISSTVGDGDDRVLTVDVDDQMVYWPDGTGISIKDYIELEEPSWDSPADPEQSCVFSELLTAAKALLPLSDREDVSDEWAPQFLALQAAVDRAAAKQAEQH